MLCTSACNTENTPTADESAPTQAQPAQVKLSPEQTLARLIALAKEGDWDAYVDDFYGESHKFEGIAERRQTVIDRFRDKWAATVIEGFESLDPGNAVISEDGKKAVFMKDGEPSFNLFLNDDGKWTFHL